MDNITEKQLAYIQKIHFHLKKSCPRYIIDKYDLLRIPSKKWEASKYISYVGEICRKHVAELVETKDDHTDRLHLNSSVKDLLSDVDEFGCGFNDHFEGYPSINCKDDI